LRVLSLESMDPVATKEKPIITLKLEENGHDSVPRVNKRI